MTNLDSIFKSRDITLPTKVRLVNAMIFPVVMYGSLINRIWNKIHFLDLQGNPELLVTCADMWDQVGNLWGFLETKTTEGLNQLYIGDLENAGKTLDQAFVQLRDLGDVHTADRASYFLGRVEEERGNYKNAKTIYLECFISLQSRQDLLWMCCAMESLASVFLKEDDKRETAIILLANAESIRLKCQAPQLPDQKEYLDPTVFELKRKMQEHKFKSLWNQASKYSSEECIDMVVG